MNKNGILLNMRHDTIVFPGQLAGDEIHLYVVPATNLLFLFSNRSQESLEISIRRSSYEVRTLSGQESRPCRVFTYATAPPLTATIDLRRRLMTCRCQ